MSSIYNKGFYKNAGGLVRPTTRDELVEEINIRINRSQFNLNDIDTSRITNMNSLFSNFNQNVDISCWDVSNVKCMISMFQKCAKFNSDLSEWDVSNVEDISLMFFGCAKFNSDLSKWSPSKLQYMINTFHNSGILVLPKWFYSVSKHGVL